MSSTCQHRSNFDSDTLKYPNVKVIEDIKYILTFYILLAKDQQRLSGNEFCTNFLHSLMIEFRDIYLKNFHSMGFLNTFICLNFILVSRTERNTILSVILLWIVILSFCVPVFLSHGLMSAVSSPSIIE